MNFHMICQRNQHQLNQLCKLIKMQHINHVYCQQMEHQHKFYLCNWNQRYPKNRQHQKNSLRMLPLMKLKHMWYLQHILLQILLYNCFQVNMHHMHHLLSMLLGHWCRFYFDILLLFQLYKFLSMISWCISTSLFFACCIPNTINITRIFNTCNLNVSN
ncbi:unnamed protein product [Paramecium sonneborni]|uniref:Uncharacterized protein n=1 Tax=Paramecium sonneborni TaxID=65129 RepID=A0A8S1RBJ8_9CILI|nr:unnamed protein product [Paramecium sonneborni]